LVGRGQGACGQYLPAVKKSDLEQADPSVTRDELRGDILVRGFWECGTDCIIDVRVTDTDAKSNLSKDPAKVLEAHENEKEEIPQVMS
jgi:hypothetical protein